MFNSDHDTLQQIMKSLTEEQYESLEKAMKHKEGLVYIQKPVNKKGKQFMQGFWVKPSEAAHFKHVHAKELSETRDQHLNEKGQYNQDRAKLHKKILYDILGQCSKPEPGKKPVLVIMGGGSASGKSTMRKATVDIHMGKKGIKVGTVDADEIKSHLPEYESLKSSHPDDAARLVHEESSDITALAIDTLLRKGMNFVYDGTAKNKDKYQALVKEAKKRGFEVHLYVADCSLETAKKRSDARAKKEGRYVPHSIIESSHKGVPKTVEAIKEQVDSYQVYSTEKGGAPELIASNDHINPEEYAKFVGKAGINYSAKD